MQGPRACVRFQVIEEAAEPGASSLGVRPNLDVLCDTLEYRTSEFQIRIYAMNRRGPLQVQSTIVFRQHVLAVGLFSHFYVRDRISSLFQVCDLCRRVFRRTVEHRDRNHCRKIACNAAGVKEIESRLIAGFHVVGRNQQIRRLVPRINRGTVRR